MVSNLSLCPNFNDSLAEPALKGPFTNKDQL